MTLKEVPTEKTVQEENNKIAVFYTGRLFCFNMIITRKICEMRCNIIFPVI